jgi:hypothetical protein
MMTMTARIFSIRYSVLTIVIAFTVGLLIAPLPAWSQNLEYLYKQIRQHYQAGRYSEAERFAKKALSITVAFFF